jgi:hypothetical protein
MATSSDWVTLAFEPEVVVPDDAWAGWDAENQVFLTAADVYTETQTALLKSTVYYPADFFQTVTWHDGSPFSVADFVALMIASFDLGGSAVPFVSTRIKMGKTADVVAVVQTGDKLLSNAKNVKVTIGGCGG